MYKVMTDMQILWFMHHSSVSQAEHWVMCKLRRLQITRSVSDQLVCKLHKATRCHFQACLQVKIFTMRFDFSSYVDQPAAEKKTLTWAINTLQCNTMIIWNKFRHIKKYFVSSCSYRRCIAQCHETATALSLTDSSRQWQNVHSDWH